MVYYAAAFSYYAPLALIPLVLISLTIVGKFYGASYTAEIFFGWGTVLGTDLAKIIGLAVDNLTIEANQFLNPTAGVILFSSICIVALNVISSGFQRLWGIEDQGIISWFYRSFRSIVLIFVLQIYLIIVIGLEVIIKSFNFGSDSFLSSIFLFLATTAFFTFLYRFLYRTSPKIKSCFIGAIFGSILFIGAKYLVYAYVISTPILDLYGAAGLILVLLIWVYVLSAIIFYGAAIAGIHDQILKAKLTIWFF